MDNLNNKLNKIKITGSILYNEPMKNHTTFRIGGPADVYIRPSCVKDIITVFETAKDTDTPIFPIGDGSNLLVSDKGIRGIVLDMSEINNFSINDTLFYTGAGMKTSDAAYNSAKAGLSGLHPFYAMPGSIGGSVWMNARCYGISISDILESVEFLDEDLKIKKENINKTHFDYKKSPFQKRAVIILSACFNLKKSNRKDILNSLDTFKKDREKKGHFEAPSAGSIFKNNRQFKKPSGMIIDSLGLKGFSIGGARISEHHANIIVNTGNATALEAQELIDYIEKAVKSAYGITLEKELLFIGQW